MRVLTKRRILIMLAGAIFICTVEISIRIMSRFAIIGITYATFRYESSFTQMQRDCEIERQHNKTFSSTWSADEVIRFYRRWFGFHFSPPTYLNSGKVNLYGRPFTITKQALLMGKYLEVGIEEGYWDEEIDQKVTYVFLWDYMFD